LTNVLKNTQIFYIWTLPNNKNYLKMQNLYIKSRGIDKEFKA